MTTKVSKTNDDELLIYKSDGDGGYVNIIIDSDGDIELMHIPLDRSETFNTLNASINETIEFWNKFK